MSKRSKTGARANPFTAYRRELRFIWLKVTRAAEVIGEDFDMSDVDSHADDWLDAMNAANNALTEMAVDYEDGMLLKEFNRGGHHV